MNWRMGDIYRQTFHWEEMRLEGYQSQHKYCLMRGDNISNAPLAWEASNKRMKLKPKTFHRIIDLIFKLTGELFDMARFPSRDAGPWDKLIQVQDLFIAIQQRYVAAKDAIELVLETSKKSLPATIEKLREHEKIM